MRSALDVSFELGEANKLLELAAIYSRTAPNHDPECWARNQQSLARKIEDARAFLDAIESKLKPTEVEHVKAA